MRRQDLALAIACAALGIWVYRRVLGGFFSPDDFIWLERALHILPPHRRLWRVVSARVYFESLLPVFGMHPARWLAANLALHAGVTCLLFAWIRRAGGSLAAATLGAGLFAVSRLHFTALAQATTAGELLAGGFGLLALLTALGPGWRAEVASLACFVAALLSKETVVAMPLVLLFVGPGALPAAVRMRRAGALLAIGLAWIATIAISGDRQVFAGGAYDTRYGMNLFHNLMTYADWCVDFERPIPDLFGTFSTTAWKTGVVLVAALTVGAALTRRRTPLVTAGAAWWLLALIPVVPLVYHSYLHYLYGSSMGLAIAMAGALDALRLRPASKASVFPVAVWATVIILVGLYAATCMSLLDARYAQQVPDMDLPFDPFLRKIELAKRASDGVGDAVAHGARRVALVLPRGDDKPYGDLILEVIDHGRALRALYPALDSVAADTVAAAGPGFVPLRVAPDGRITNLETSR